MATFEIVGDTGQFVERTGSEMAGIIHLNPTPQTVGSGEAIVYSSSTGNDYTGMVLIELPPPVSGTNGMMHITITGYNFLNEVNGGGAWRLTLGGYTYSSGASPIWYNSNAFYSGPAAFAGPQTVQLLSKGTSPNGLFGIALGSPSTAWYHSSLQIKVQAGYLTNDSTLQNPWTVTQGVTSLTEWSTEVLPVRRSLISTGDTMTGLLNMAGNRISNLGSAVFNTDAVNLSQLNTKSPLLRIGTFTPPSISAMSAVTVYGLSRTSGEYVISVANIAGNAFWSWAVAYPTSTTFNVTIANEFPDTNTFGQFHYYLAPGTMI